MAVIEGDLQTDNDARRVAASGAQAVQINTEGGCHLDSSMVSEALQSIDEGREVEVRSVAADGSAEVIYRGARWRARAAVGSLAAGRWTIGRVDGTELVLEKKESIQS